MTDVTAPAPSFQVSRRSFLATLSALSVGSLVGCDLPAHTSDESMAGGLGGRRGLPPRTVGDDDNYTPLLPFALTVASELSQDFFLFQTHRIDPVKDTVVAYSRADGEVEAMLLQDGAVKQIYRDLNQPGGWGIYTFPDAGTGVVDMVAGISAPKHDNHTSASAPALKVFYRTSGDPDTLHVAVHDAGDKPSFTTTKVPWNKASGPLQISVSYDDSLLVAAIRESGAVDTGDGWLDIWSDCSNAVDNGPIYGTLGGFAYNTQSASKGLAPGWAATIARPTSALPPQVALVLPAGTYAPIKIGNTSFTSPSVHLWSWAIHSNRPGASLSTPMTSFLTYANVPKPPSATTTAYRVEYANALGSVNAATMVVRTLDTADGKSVQRLWTLSPNDNGLTAWQWNELVLPADVAADTSVVVSASVRPLPDTEKAKNAATAARRFMDVFVLANGTLHVVRQAPTGDANSDYVDPSYCPAIALHPGVTHMDGQAGISSGDELLLVGSDGDLQTLVKDPTSGVWADRPVQLPAGDLEETTSYRLTLAVTDAWNMPVPDHALHVSTSSATTALVNGTAVVVGTEPVAVTTDRHGEVTLALIADGLSAPTLTVAGGSLPTATINPSDPINTYLQGGSDLNYLPPLTSDSLAAAKTPDGDIVAPGASDGAAAKDAVTNINLAASQATSPNTLNARHSAIVKRRDGHLRSTSRAELAGVLKSIDRWAHDALHAIKKGAAKIKEITYDAASKTFHLAADFVHWADNVVQIVVKGIEDAAHVVHAFLNKLGAQIVHAIKWLAAEVLGTFRDAAALAHQFNDWIGKGCHFLAGQANADAGRVDAWLAAKQASIKADLTTLAGRYSHTSLSELSSSPPQGLSKRPTPRPQPGHRVGDSDDDSQGSPHSDWFWKKIKNELFGSLTLPAVSNVPDLMKRLLSAAEHALVDVEQAFVKFFEFLTSKILHPKDADNLGVSSLLQAIALLVDAVFGLARAMVTVLLDLIAEMANAIPGILTTPLGQAGGLIGALFKLIGLGNIPIGTVATTLYAFPAVLAYKIAHKGQGRPFNTAPHSGQNGGYGSEEGDLAFTAFTVLATWAVYDGISASEVAATGEALPLTTVVDIMSPLLVGVLTVPAIKDGEPYLAPPVSGDDADMLTFVSWLVAMMPAGLVAASEYVGHIGKDDPDLPNQQSMLTFATAASGVISLGTGIQGLKLSEEATGWEYADVILNSIPTIAAAGLDSHILKATEKVSGVVTAVLTLATGLGGSLAHAHAVVA